MSDTFDDTLRKLLRNGEISMPDKDIQNQHISDSLKVFSQKNQESWARRRLKDVLTIIEEIPMKKAYIAGGAIALGSLAIVLTNSTMLTQMMPAAVQEQLVANEDTTPVDQSKPDNDMLSEQAVTIENKVTPSSPPSPPSRPQELASDRAFGYFSGSETTATSSIRPSEPMPQQPKYVGQDKFEEIDDNPVKVTSEEPVSTFSIDVDTASYSFVRRQLNSGVLPQPDAVRVEELINYFDYDYELPDSKDVPFKPTVAVYPSPWNEATQLMHIGIQGHDVVAEEKPRSNLVFLIDTSGSMQSQDKLPLLKNAFRLMVENMDEEDTVSIATYAGSAGVVLEPTKVKDKQKILNALNGLRSGGSTAGAQGIKLAYELAEANFDEDAVNRVFLATDGDFNVGITNQEELKGYIERKRDSGVFLSILGFGQGNYNDALMQTLAQNGNGTAAYIDTLNEARKVLVEEASATLYPIAKDVKIQIEFNPEQVAEYRLIGYKTRKLNREDFNNDKVDAGELGAGHSVTAIYEITLTDSEVRRIDPLRYGTQEAAEKMESGQPSGELAFLKLRYKLPDADTSKLIERPITANDTLDSIDKATPSVRFAAAVAGFGQLLRGGEHLGNLSYDDVLTLAQSAKGDDPFGYRAEFMNLVRLAKSAQAMK